MSIDNYYNSTGKVITITTSTWASTDAESCSTIMCALNPMSGREIFVAEQEGLIADYKMFCRANTSISNHNKFKVGSQKYDVIFVKDTFGMGHHKNVMLKRRG